MAALPAAVFVLLHLLGKVHPSLLWGTDVLAFYGPWATWAMLLVPLAAVAIPWPALPPSVRQGMERAAASARFPWALSLVAITLLWIARVRTHSLGDSIKWFEIVRNAIERTRSFDEIPWHNAQLHVAGFEFVNFQQPLDLILHVLVFAGLHAVGVEQVEVAYASISIGAGALYVPVLWYLSRQLSASHTSRLLAFAFFISLGTLQLFCGYGESYTVVTLFSALYFALGLDCLRGERSLWLCALVLVLAIATHTMALSLVPSFLLLAWHHPRWGAMLHRRSVYVPVSVIGTAVAVWACVRWYHGLHLPLLTPDQPGRYALLSWRHAATLGNALLLTGPFGLVWGVSALAQRLPTRPDRQFLGLAAAGAGALIVVHDITMGGRDWDLMSFPALALAAWGIAGLRDLGGDPTWVMRRILPVMVLHTALWVGVNASPERANRRLEHLLSGITNQAAHYHNWVLGYYYLEQADDRSTDAVAAFARAVQLAPPHELNTPGTRVFSYRKFLASSLNRAGRHDEALQLIREVYRLQPSFGNNADDIALHGDWANAAYHVGSDAMAHGDTTSAYAHWIEARDALERVIQWTDAPNPRKDLAVLRRLTGQRQPHASETALAR